MKGRVICAASNVDRNSKRGHQTVQYIPPSSACAHQSTHTHTPVCHEPAKTEGRIVREFISAHHRNHVQTSLRSQQAVISPQAPYQHCTGSSELPQAIPPTHFPPSPLHPSRPVPSRPVPSGPVPSPSKIYQTTDQKKPESQRMEDNEGSYCRVKGALK